MARALACVVLGFCAVGGGGRRDIRIGYLFTDAVTGCDTARNATRGDYISG